VSGQLEGIAYAAFFDLRDGQVDRYRASLSPAHRDAMADPAAQMAVMERGQAWARRRVDLMAVVDEGLTHVTFVAADEAMLTGRAPALPGLRIKATFERDGDRYGITAIAELK